MEEHRCPAVSKNKLAHAGFTKVLDGYRERYAARGYEAADARALVDEVDAWLDGHICRIDVKLKDSVGRSTVGSTSPAR
jgi:hemerythrin